MYSMDTVCDYITSSRMNNLTVTCALINPLKLCDQIYQKGSYTCTVLGLTFHGHLTDTTIDQQFMLIPLPKLQRSAFTEASFTGLSVIQGCPGCL